MPEPQTAVSAEERRAEYEAAERLAKRYRLEFVDMDHFPIDQDLFRSIPADSDAAVLVRAVQAPGQGAGHRRSRPDRPADARRALAAPWHADHGDGRRALGDRVDSEEERKLAARARGSHRELSDSAAQGRRQPRREPHRRTADERHQPGHQAGRFDDLHGDSAARERHPHRNRRRRGPREVPHRRRAAAGDAADRKAVPQSDHLAHQGHGRARHRREACAAGRPLQAEGARQDDRLPRVDHAERQRRRCGHPHSRQGIDQRAVPRAAPRHPRISRGGAEAVPEVHRRALRDGARHRARPAAARRRRSTRRFPRSNRSKTRSSRSRIRSSTSSAASRRFPSTRRRG